MMKWFLSTKPKYNSYTQGSKAKGIDQSLLLTMITLAYRSQNNAHILQIIIMQSPHQNKTIYITSVWKFSQTSIIKLQKNNNNQ